jgi:hypothetical protein
MFGFGIAKKGLQAANIISEDEVELEDQEEVVQIAAPVIFESITIKQVGNVPPSIVDPQREFEILTEAFGVFRGKQKVMELSCESCGHEATVPYESVSLDDDCTCSECEYTAQFHDFFDSMDETISSSRTPTKAELKILVGQHWSPWWDDDDLDNLRESLLAYFGVLNGELEMLNEKHTEAGDTMHLVSGAWRRKCGHCTRPGCFCGQGRMRWYNNLTSISEGAAEEGEEDDDE